MKAEILKRCSVVCEPGSVVEISESQFRALGDFAKTAYVAKATSEPNAEAEKAYKKVVKKRG